MSLRTKTPLCCLFDYGEEFLKMLAAIITILNASFKVISYVWCIFPLRSLADLDKYLWASVLIILSFIEGFPETVTLLFLALV